MTISHQLGLSDRPFPFTCHAVRKPIQPFFAFLAASGFIAFFLYLALSSPSDARLTQLYYFLFVVFWLFGLAVLPFRAGFREMLSNRVCVTKRATWVTPKVFPVEQLLVGGMGAAALASGLLLIHAFGGLAAVFQSQLQWIILGPGFVVLGALMIFDFLRQQLRGLKLTPESITYWRGIGSVTLAWDEWRCALNQ